MTKKPRIGLTSLAAALAFAVTSTAAGAVELRVATVAPPKTPWGVWMSGVAKRVAELSKGDVKLDVHFSGALGDEQTAARQAARGRIDIAGISNTAASLLVPEMQLLQTPFLWDNDKQMDCVYDKHLKSLIAEMMTAKGLVPLAYIEVGHYVLFTKKPVKTPADVAGMKLRAAPTKSNVEYLNAIGANGVPLGVADTAPALKTGGVAGVEYNPLYGVAIGTHKLAPNILITYHGHINGTLSISKRVWDKLTPAQQDAVRKGADVSDQLRAGVRKAHMFMLGKAQKDGATVTKLSVDERAVWAAKAPAVQQAMLKSIGGRAQDMWKTIQDGKAACGS